MTDLYDKLNSAQSLVKNPYPLETAVVNIAANNTRKNIYSTPCPKSITIARIGISKADIFS